MKVECRAKYSGIKLHLDEEECKFLVNGSGAVLNTLMSKVKQFLQTRPDALQPRSKKQIKQTLKAELEKSTKQLKALKRGKDWTALSR